MYIAISALLKEIAETYGRSIRGGDGSHKDTAGTFFGLQTRLTRPKVLARGKGSGISGAKTRTSLQWLGLIRSSFTSHQADTIERCPENQPLGLHSIVMSMYVYVY